MTREHKLALIVGFSLVLLVTVLISDHLSRARQARVDQVRPPEVAAAPGLEPQNDPVRVLESVAARTPQIARVPDPEPVTLGGDPEPQTPTTVATVERPLTGPGAEFPEQSPTLVARNDTIDPLEEAVRNQGGEIIRGTDGVSRLVLPPSLPQAAETRKTRQSGPGQVEIPVITPRGAARAEAAPDTKPRTPQADEAVRVHNVKRGETLFQIAERYYGNGKLWPQLAKFNNTEKDGTVRAGMRLKIPSRDTLVAAPRSSTPRSSEQASSPTREEQTPRTQPQRRSTMPKVELASYTVRKGDTLGGISQKTLGSARRWQEIVKLNGIDDEDNIPAGTVLKIPAAPRATTASASTVRK